MSELSKEEIIALLPVMSRLTETQQQAWIERMTPVQRAAIREFYDDFVTKLQAWYNSLSPEARAYLESPGDQAE